MMLFVLSSLAWCQQEEEAASGASAPEVEADVPVRFKDQGIDPKVLTDVTAYTVGKNRWRIGLLEQEFGLLHNLSIGTTTLLWLPPLSTPNATAKVTAIQTPKFDASLDGGIYFRSLEDLDVKNGQLWVTPIGWTGSWIPHRRWGVHFGQSWILAQLNGELEAVEIAEGLAAGLGLDGDVVQSELLGAIGEDGQYAGANLSLVKFRFAMDYRLNRRDSIIFTYNQYLTLSGLIAAGGVNELDGATTEVGASARIQIPLVEQAQALSTIAWQWSMERFHLRLGLPVPLGNAFAWPQAIKLYWVLGKKREPVTDEAS